MSDGVTKVPEIKQYLSVDGQDSKPDVDQTDYNNKWKQLY